MSNAVIAEDAHRQGKGHSDDDHATMVQHADKEVPPRQEAVIATLVHPERGRHHTLHAFLLTIGAVSPHLNARWNSGMFTTTPLTRYRSGECGFVIALARR